MDLHGAKLTLLKCELAILETRRAGYEAENEQRAMEDAMPAYREDAFAGIEWDMEQVKAKVAEIVAELEAKQAPSTTPTADDDLPSGCRGCKYSNTTIGVDGLDTTACVLVGPPAWVHDHVVAGTKPHWCPLKEVK